MSSDGILQLKRVAMLFTAVLIAYLLVFNGIEYWRQTNGPWIVLFDTNQAGHPMLVIEHEKRNLQNVRVTFLDETITATNIPARLSFNRPRQPLPFGRRLHEDLVKLPGVETFEMFGHVVELAPRRLVLDGREIPWKSGQAHALWASNKLDRPMVPAKSMRDTSN